MLVASVLDPDLFSPENMEAPYFKSMMIQRLDAIIKHHVFVLDGRNTTSSFILKDFLDLKDRLPAPFQQRLALLIGGQRQACVEMKDSCLERHNQMEGVVALKGSAASAALTVNPHVDVALLSEKTQCAAKTAGCDSNKMTTAATHDDTPTYALETNAGEAQSVEGWSRQRFLDKIITPVVYWAKHIKLFDPYLCKAVITNQDNRSRFKDTIAAIYDAWRQGAFCGRGQMEIISSFDSWHEETNYNSQAKMIADFLDLKDGHVSICLKKHVPKHHHERYLTTSQGVVLGASRGFDVLSGNGCIAADFYIRKPKKDDPIDAQAHGPVIARYTYNSPVQQEFKSNPFESVQL